MSNVAMESARLIDMLPEHEQIFALEVIKKLVLAWDPDYTKLTQNEANALASAEASGFVSSEDIDWSNIGQ